LQIFLKIEKLKNFKISAEPIAKNQILSLENLTQENLLKFLLENYPIYEDDKNLRNNIKMFEQLRAKYNYRREFYVNK
jgi:Domain of unknown function (DUF3410).